MLPSVFKTGSDIVETQLQIKVLLPNPAGAEISVSEPEG